MLDSIVLKRIGKKVALLLLVFASQAPGGSIDPLSLLRLQPMPWSGQPSVGSGLAKSMAFDGSNYVVAFQSFMLQLWSNWLDRENTFLRSRTVPTEERISLEHPTLCLSAF